MEENEVYVVFKNNCLRGVWHELRGAVMHARDLDSTDVVIVAMQADDDHPGGIDPAQVWYHEDHIPAMSNYHGGLERWI